jgi:hypothetical protein
MVLPPKMRRETSRVSFLMCPFCVRQLSPNQATRVAIRWRHRPATEGARRNRCRCSWGGTLGARLLRTISGSIRCFSYSLCFTVRRVAPRRSCHAVAGGWGVEGRGAAG